MTAIPGLTLPQQRVLEFIEQSIQVRGLSPTISEICGYTSRGRGAVHATLVCLRDRGFIQWKEKLPRSIVLLNGKRAFHILPADLQAKLERFCAEHNEQAAAVVADAVALHLDALEGVEEAA